MEDAHARTVDEVVTYFNLDTDKGLSPDQVKRNQEKYGLNGKFQFKKNSKLNLYSKLSAWQILRHKTIL
jgi:Cation transporter/ATPase, N-terminus